MRRATFRQPKHGRGSAAKGRPTMQTTICALNEGMSTDIDFRKSLHSLRNETTDLIPIGLSLCALLFSL
jgi:hypothetical protein